MRALVSSFFLFTFLALGSIQAWAADGHILSFSGEVWVNGVPVTAATEVNSQDTIVTGPDGTVMIVLADNSVLDIAEDSEIVVSEYVYSPEEPEENASDVAIVEGTLRYVSGFMSKQDPTDISFSAGSSTIGVRGTFTIISSNGGVVTIEAVVGITTVSYPTDDGLVTVPVEPGNTSTTKPGEPPLVVATTASTASEVGALVQAIAEAATNNEGDAKAAIQEAIVAAGVEDNPEIMALAVAVLSDTGNATELGINTAAVESVVVATVGAVAAVNPEAASAAVLVATVVNNPDSADDAPNPFQEAAQESIQDAVDDANKASEAGETLTPEQERALEVEAEVSAEINLAAKTGIAVALDVVLTDTVRVITDDSAVSEDGEVLTEEVETVEVVTEDTQDSGVIVEPDAPPLPGGASDN